MDRLLSHIRSLAAPSQLIATSVGGKSPLGVAYTWLKPVVLKSVPVILLSCEMPDSSSCRGFRILAELPLVEGNNTHSQCLCFRRLSFFLR